MKLLKWYNRVPLIYLNLGAFVLGCAGGLLLYWLGGIFGKDFLNTATNILAPFGNILVNMLKMIVMPIIFCTIICGAASLPLKTFGKMGLGVCAWYFFTSLFAAVFGCIISVLFNPTLSVAPEKLLDKSLMDLPEIWRKKLPRPAARKHFWMWFTAFSAIPLRHWQMVSSCP